MANDILEPSREKKRYSNKKFSQVPCPRKTRAITGFTFSKVPSTKTFFSECTGALTFEGKKKRRSEGTSFSERTMTMTFEIFF